MFNIITYRKNGLDEYIRESKRLIACYLIDNNEQPIRVYDYGEYDCYVCNTFVDGATKRYKYSDVDFCDFCGADILYQCVDIKDDIIEKIMFIHYLFLPDLHKNMSRLTKNVIMS